MNTYVLLMLAAIFFGDTNKGIKSIGLKKSNNVTPLNCLFIALWCMLALKAETIGSDTMSYIRVFNEAVSWNKIASGKFFEELFINKSRYETGYVVFNRVVAYFTENPQWIFVITATFFVLVCRKLICEKSTDMYLSIFLFIALRFFYFSMSGLRQAIAMYICVIAYKYIEMRRPIIFVLCVILAMQFHITAVIFFLAYPLSFMKFNKLNCFLIIVCGAIVFLSFDVILTKVLGYVPEYYSHYTSTVRFKAGNIGNILVAIVQLIFLLLSAFSAYGKEKKETSSAFDEPSFMKNMMLVSVLLSVVSIKATTLDRLYYYFWIFAIIYIPNVINGLLKKDNTKIIISFFVIVFTMTYNLTLLYYRPEWFNVTPYKFFWN